MEPMIDKNIIDDVRAKTDIVEVISDYVALRKRGKNYLALCPFHSEKTASFTVSQEKQMFHCFGCSEGGNVFSFLMKIENISFQEALRMMAQKAGIELDLPSQDNNSYFEERKKLADIISYAADYFHAELTKSKIAMDYLTSRKVPAKAISFFKLGYSPDSWDSLYRFLASKGYLPIDIEKAGLIISRENNSYYDRFRNRLMIPIYDVKGSPAGFGARSLDGSEPKYLNSPDSPVYNKSKILFGLHHSKDHIKREGKALIVEGYMDFITAFYSGVTNVVASSGTALTVDHVKTLQRFTEEIVLVFDSDAAGAAAAERSIDIVRGCGLYPKIAVPTGGKDPDEAINNAGIDSFKNDIEGAQPAIRFKIDKILLRNKINEAEGKAKAAKEIASALSGEKDMIIRSEYLKYASGRLGIDKDLMAADIKKFEYALRSPAMRDYSTTKPLDKTSKAEKVIIKIGLEDANIFSSTAKEISHEDFSDNCLRDIFVQMTAAAAAGIAPDCTALMNDLESEDAKKALSAIALEDAQTGDRSKAAVDCINVIKSGKLKSRIETLRKEIQEAENISDMGAVTTLQSEYKECFERLHAFPSD